MSGHPFEYRKASDEHVKVMTFLSTAYSAVYDALLEYVEPSAERTLAIRKLQEARMWSNVAVLGIEIAK